MTHQRSKSFLFFATLLLLVIASSFGGCDRGRESETPTPTPTANPYAQPYPPQPYPSTYGQPYPPQPYPPQPYPSTYGQPYPPQPPPQPSATTPAVQPSPFALPCQNDLVCGFNKCNMQTGRCASPCTANTDCAAGFSCFGAGSPTAICVPGP